MLADASFVSLGWLASSYVVHERIAGMGDAPVSLTLRSDDIFAGLGVQKEALNIDFLNLLTIILSFALARPPRIQ